MSLNVAKRARSGPAGDANVSAWSRLVATVTDMLPSKAGARVLCVDDDPAMLELLRQALAGEGVEVHLARGGEEALGMIDQVRPEACIVDLLMPGMSGLELIAQLRTRADTQNIPIVILSARHLNEEEEKALGDTVQRFVRKTDFKAGDLAATMRQTIRWMSRDD
ncbi:MAG: hypothetical protein NVS1B12_17240 [Acidimicrobiales bacterium]